MKLFKTFLAIVLIFGLTFSCKSEKKDVQEAAEEAIEAVEETAEDVQEAAEEAVEEVEEAVEEAAEAVEEGVQEAGAKAISVYYPMATELANEVDKAIKRLVADNPTIEKHFHEAYGYVIFPVITKAGLGVGGAGGKGLVFEKNKVVGSASLAQATIGLQAGGQQYMEVIFFENKAAIDRFKEGKIKFSGQASAVALKEGASVDLAYQDGVAVFTKAKGGLMAEASLGGQKFKYKDGI